MSIFASILRAVYRLSESVKARHPLHASAVAAGSDRSRHGIRRTPAGFGIGAGVAAGEGKMRRM